MTEEGTTQSGTSGEVHGGQSPTLLGRQKLENLLVSEGLVTPEFYASGMFDAFLLDEKAEFDGLTHVLLGDKREGVHHLSTLMALNIDSVEVASALQDPRFPDKSYSRVVRSQAVRDNGVHRPLHVVITHTHNGRDYTLEKRGGSTMFPDEWSTQEVLEAMINVSKLEGKESDRGSSLVHDGVVHDVHVRVYTDRDTGKIISGMPIFSSRTTGDVARIRAARGPGISVEALTRKAATRAARAKRNQ